MAVDAVGRGDEIAVVERWLDSVADGATALLIEGEAGIGKSTILRAALPYDCTRARELRGVAGRLRRRHEGVSVRRPLDVSGFLDGMRLARYS